MSDWVLAVERAYVAAATGRGATAAAAGDPAQLARARGAAGAVASRYLAVGTPRTMGFLAGADGVAGAIASHAAHRTWFQPSDLRCAGEASAELAAALGGHIVSTADALACDIICVHAPMALAAHQLRRGSHVNALAAVELDADLQRLATVVHEHPGLGRLAAGFEDGRQLDELTVFVLGA